MNYDIRYSPQSRKDLDDILDFLVRTSDIDVAKRVISEIIEKIRSLSFMPGGYNFDERIERKLNKKYPTQAILCKKYIILFVVKEEIQEVYITHVISSKSDYLRLLK